jgi:hypothetical protein
LLIAQYTGGIKRGGDRGAIYRILKVRPGGQDTAVVDAPANRRKNRHGREGYDHRDIAALIAAQAPLNALHACATRQPKRAAKKIANAYHRPTRDLRGQ